MIFGTNEAEAEVKICLLPDGEYNGLSGLQFYVFLAEESSPNIDSASHTMKIEIVDVGMFHLMLSFQFHLKIVALFL